MRIMFNEMPFLVVFGSNWVRWDILSGNLIAYFLYRQVY